MKSISDKYWIRKDKDVFSFKLDSFAKEFKIHDEILDILASRGVTGRDSIKKFLYPVLQDLDDPFLMKGMQEACSLLYEAVIESKNIIIWGDYDVDGVTATTLLLRFFRSINIFPKWFIPNRFNDGYGLNKKKLKKIIDDCDTRDPLLVTVDCGITNFEEIEYAQKLGCKVIITDHHEPDSDCVKGDAVINVKQHDCAFPDKDLAGVGVAFFLAVGLRAYLNNKKFFRKQPQPNVKHLLELVAIGTIADMVPLHNTNRLLVKAGFEVINTAPSLGVESLLNESDIYDKNITSDDVAFQIAPKINAAGRLSDASIAVQLLLAEDQQVAEKLARKISMINSKRKSLCRDNLDNTLENATKVLKSGLSSVVLQLDCSIGILGIVASQLADRLHVPIVLVSQIDDAHKGRVLKGSCRSVAGLDIYNILGKCSNYLLQYGGHKMAAGITLFEDQLIDFTNIFNRNIKEITDNIERKKTFFDIEIETEKVFSSSFLQQLKMLEPFGIANEKPIFIHRRSTLQDIKRIGKNGDHLIFYKRGKYENQKCVAFNFGNYEEVLKSRPVFDMVYTVSISRFKRAQHYQANVIDFV